MSDSADLRRSNRTLLVKLFVIAVAMFGFGYGLVPSTTGSARRPDYATLPSPTT